MGRKALQYIQGRRRLACKMRTGRSRSYHKGACDETNTSFSNNYSFTDRNDSLPVEWWVSTASDDTNAKASTNIC
jgi:hypothetical protein